MKERPTSITVISWILIVLGGLNVATTVRMMNHPKVIEIMEKSSLPINVQHAIGFFGLGVMIVSGAAMLYRQNWARYLYVGWGTIGIIIGLLTSPMKAMLLPGILVLFLIAFFLFRPKATEFFTDSEDSSTNGQAV